MAWPTPPGAHAGDVTPTAPGVGRRSKPGPTGGPRPGGLPRHRESAADVMDLHPRGEVPRAWGGRAPPPGSSYARRVCAPGPASTAKRLGRRDEPGRDPSLDQRPAMERGPGADETLGRTRSPGEFLLLVLLRLDGLDDRRARRGKREGEADRPGGAGEVVVEGGEAGVRASGRRRSDRRGRYGHQQRQRGRDADSPIEASVGHGQQSRAGY